MVVQTVVSAISLLQPVTDCERLQLGYEKRTLRKWNQT